MKKKLIDEISVQELQQMRADGLSNREIAERLECSTMTVQRYIGKQPDGLRKPRGYYQTRVKDVEKPGLNVTRAPKTDLILTSKTEIYRGKDMTYTVTLCGNCVRIRNNDEIDGGNGAIQLNRREELENFILELIDLTGVIKNG